MCYAVAVVLDFKHTFTTLPTKLFLSLSLAPTPAELWSLSETKKTAIAGQRQQFMLDVSSL